jgi:hypothetical protein
MRLTAQIPSGEPDGRVLSELIPRFKMDGVTLEIFSESSFGSPQIIILALFLVHLPHLPSGDSCDQDPRCLT